MKRRRVEHTMIPPPACCRLRIVVQRWIARNAIKRHASKTKMEVRK